MAREKANDTRIRPSIWTRMGEIAIQLRWRIDGKCIPNGDASLTLALVSKKEKETILAVDELRYRNRAADGAAKLIALQNRARLDGAV
jgi:hypothetical protein